MMNSVENYNLTNPQKLIWITEQFYKNTPVNNICGTLKINEEVDFEKFIQSIQIFIKQNDSFRIKLCFDENNEIKQYFSPFVDFDKKVYTLNSLEELHELEKEFANTAFSLINSPLFHFKIFNIPNTCAGFVLNIHHLIGDAWTTSLVVNKIINIYTSLLNNETPSEKEFSYLDYIHNEKEYMQSTKYNSDKEFWDSCFTDVPDIASLSTKNSEIKNSCKSKREFYCISQYYLSQIETFCKENKISVFNFFIAVYSLYIGKVKNLQHFVVGTPILNRTNFAEKNTCGMFISTIPFPVHMEKQISFKHFASLMGVHTLGMLRHQKYPYESILEHLRKSDNSIPNLYNIMISYQNTKINRESAKVNYEIYWTHADATCDELDIHLFDNNNDGVINIAYDYQLDLYTTEDIKKIHERILNVIAQILNNKDILVDDIEVVTPDEKNYLLYEYNSKKMTQIKKSIIELFEEQVSKNPNAIALCEKDTCLTYSELDNISNNLCTFMSRKGIKPKDKVCLFFENSINLVTSILACLKFNCCYIPINTAYPIDRIEYIVHNSGSKHILTDKHNVNLLHILSNMSILVDFSTFNRCHSIAYNCCNLKDLAYIIYTSGSTGNPKGVKISNESLVNYITWANKVYVEGEKINFPLYSSISFDLTVTSVFTPLISGNTLYVYTGKNAQIILQKILTDEKVQIIKLTPAHLSLLLDCVPSKCLKKLILGGDILTNELCEKITKIYPNIAIYNEYGPTETTVGCMIYKYNKNDLNKYASVPIGIPADNTKLYVLNHYHNLIPFEYSGNLFIAGRGLSKGYVKLKKVTDEKFIPSPFHKNEKIYDTGDIVKLHSNGLMEYVGRSDFQIKINGYRIEIGEIQSRILNFPDIKDCYVTVLEKDGSKHLCAYYTCSKPANLNLLKNYLRKCLPIYMVPRYYVLLDEFPFTSNGKVNKKELPMPTTFEHDVFVPAQTPLEKELHDIFCKLLNISEISVTANIFDYYVDSLIIIKAQTILLSKKIEINTQAFYEFPSIRGLAEYISIKNEVHNVTHTEFLRDISTIQKENPYSRKTYKNILLFGVTGFLGIHILYYLLENTNSNIYCIIREKDNLNAIERFENKFKFYFDKETLEKYESRIITITGNLLKENFGISQEVFDEFLPNIDCVIDSAALVKHYGNYDDFKKTNVEGTAKVIDFCCKNNLPLHYISTMSISGYGLVKTPNVEFDENSFYIGQNVEDNVYVRSKFEAESLILQACKTNNLIASIYRIGNITNRFSDGFFQQNAGDNAFLNRVSSIINLGCIPEELKNINFELSPVDYCALFIVNLLQNVPKNINIYHIYNEQKFTISQFLHTLEHFNINLKTTTLDEFKKILFNSKDSHFGIINYVDNINNSDLHNIRLSNNLTNQTLDAMNLKWPDITDEYIKKILDYLSKNNFIGGTYEKR